MLLGAYADYLLIPSHIVALNAFRKPESIDFDQAALLEPLSCVVHANDMARPQPAETALIVGAGAFGRARMQAKAKAAPQAARA